MQYRKYTDLALSVFFLQLGDNMAFFTVAVISALCLVLASTRKYAVLGAGLLLYFYPFPTLGLLAAAGVAYYYIHWRNSHAH